ncbi:MAG: T9SS type A sorting domain-containing protein [Saprospiraceae bacterium]
MKNMIFVAKFGILSLFFSYGSFLHSQTCTATMNGNWNDVFTGMCSAFIIESGVSVTINTMENVTIQMNGTITIKSGGTLVIDGTLNLGATATLFIEPTGIISGIGSITSGGQTYTATDMAPNNFASIMLQGNLFNGTLPITLTSFTGEQVENTIALKWATATEKDNAYMTIERSPDGRHFTALKRIAGHGTTHTPQFYNWNDPAPLPGMNYYRLRQVDFDGRHEYHPIIAVEFTAKNPSGSIRLYPTEVQHHLNLVLDAPLQEEATLRISDLAGRMLHQQQLSAGSHQAALAVSGLAPGHYCITLQTGSHLATARFLKSTP